MQPEDCSPQPTNLIKNPNRAKKWPHLITIHSDSWRKDRHKERISSPFIPISRTSLLSSLPGGTPSLRHRLRKSGAPSMRTSSFSSASENEAYFSSNVFLHMALVFFFAKERFSICKCNSKLQPQGVRTEQYFRFFMFLYIFATLHCSVQLIVATNRIRLSIPLSMTTAFSKRWTTRQR